MQMVEILAQECRHKASSVQPSSLKRTTSMAMEARTSRRTGAGLCSGSEVMVLLVRKTNQGRKVMGQHDKARNDREVSSLFPEWPATGTTLSLSEAERALIHRRRMGLSQKQMAKSFGIKRRRYSEQETNDTLKIPGFMIDISPLEQSELCLIWRRRSGWTQQACADLMGITRYWYNLMENGKAPSDALEAFWNEG